MLITITSLTGSPGASAATLALTWTWPRHAIAVECDPSGGQALAVFDPGGSLGHRGMFEAMLAARTMPLPRALWQQAITLPDGTGRHFLLPGSRTTRTAESLQWQRLVEAVRGWESVDVLADCGRLRARGTPHAVLGSADLVVLVVRNDRHSLRALASSADVVREEIGLLGSADDGLVVVSQVSAGAQRFGVKEIDRQLGKLGLPVVGELPWDPSAAAQLTDTFNPGKRFERSPLLERARQLGLEIGKRAFARSRRLREPVRHVPASGLSSQREVVRRPQALPMPRPVREGEQHAGG
ncbi:hypothetical protein [Amycolatopsis sp. WAC 04197]|uniref:hypothetical protein n=1 Tax=Amycolatopsis sp. WAC 04197 TaxID=2203199 RepID=UPI0018F34A4C|nr:hypothetical protein [Amycolatopsis sp. WAC 04197]